MADGAGVPGVRMIANGARVRMDITTNKEQCQDKETPKGGPVNKKRSRLVVTGQWAAQRKNSSRQWGRSFNQAPQEICPAILTHPHWVGDCTTMMRWQDVGAEPVGSLVESRFFGRPWPVKPVETTVKFSFLATKRHLNTNRNAHLYFVKNKTFHKKQTTPYKNTC